jgi:nickel/cobalt exporter
MPDFLHALQSGAGNLWLFIPAAILLGALHGLEPGHSKTMMAAFIVAIRGTVWQAVLLGLSAAISHSLIIWILAAFALKFGSQWNAEHIEPYLQIGSAICILALAAWMFFRTRRELADSHQHHHGNSDRHNPSDHDHEHGHHHAHEERILVPTGHGRAELSIFEKDYPPVFRLAFSGEMNATPGDFALETLRDDGTRQIFAFAAKGGFYESTTDIPEPHQFDALLTFSHGGHEHTARVQFREGEAPRVADETGEYQDAHERAHAIEIAQRFAGRTVTTPQLVLFGITGGLMPCPAAFTVLLVCLQLKRATLGFAMVAAFSFGLALTMVAVGVIAALSVQHAQRKFRGFGEAMRRAPYVSCALLVVLALYMAVHGWRGFASHV